MTALLRVGALGTMALLCGGAMGAEVIVTRESGPAMPAPRMGHWQATLPSGEVVVIGGHGTGFVSLGTTARLDSAGEAWTAGTTLYTHDFPATVELSNAQLLLAGGAANLGVAPGYDTAELYDLATGECSATTGTMNYRRSGFAGAQLTGGKVLLAGAWYAPTQAAITEVWDPATGTFSLAGTLESPRAYCRVFPLTDGRGLVLGGVGPYGSPPIERSEVYDPETNSFSTLATQLFDDEAGWALGYWDYNRPLADQRMVDGRYLYLAYKTVSSVNSYRLMALDLADGQTSRVPIDLPAENFGFAPIVTRDGTGAWLFAYVVKEGVHGTEFYYADLVDNVLHGPSAHMPLPGYYTSYTGRTWVDDDTLLVTGGTTSNTSSTNFNPVASTILLTFALTASPTPAVLEPVLHLRLAEPATMPGREPVQYVYTWTSSAGHEPVVQGPTDSTEAVLRADSPGVSMEPGTTWTVTVTPRGSDGTDGPTSTARFIITAEGDVRFEGWIVG